MKATFIATMLFAAALGANAQTLIMQADIPFDFIVGAKVMPAGLYEVKHATGVLTLRKQGEAPQSIMALSQPARRPAAEKPATLIFNRYGDDYFLSRVWPVSGDTGPTLPQGRREKELVARGTAVQTAGVRSQAR